MEENPAPPGGPSGSTRQRELDGLASLFDDALGRRRSLAITGIFIMMLLYTVYFASPVLIPITVALLLNMLLAPAVRLLNRLYIPRALASAALLFSLMALLVGIVYLLSTPAQEWLHRVPGSFYKIEQKLRTLKQPIEEIQKATEQIEEATQLGKPSDTRTVEIKRPGLTDVLLRGTPRIIATIGVVVILLFFLLASGDAFLRKLVAVTPTLHDKKRAVEIIRSIQEDISYYLMTITMVNVALGTAVAIALALMEVPNPLLWGTMVAILNFAPYIGAATSLTVLSMVGMLTFDTLAQSLMVPGVFLALTATGQFILPMILGHRLTLSPVAIFIAIILWGWMWGILGALLAVPLLASFKIVCEQVEPLHPIAEFLTP